MKFVSFPSRDFWRSPGKNKAAAEDEEEIDFTPQNGYVEEEEQEMEVEGGKDRSVESSSHLHLIWPITISVYLTGRAVTGPRSLASARR